MAGTAAASFDGLLELESTFYQAGYDGGFPHGELHGLFEGRELGRDKSWELWEELGYYEGAAKLWQAILGSQGDGANPRAMQSLQAIRTLVSAFPASNDSTTLQSAPAEETADLDITAQLATLRSKYRTSCALVGMRPRMTVSSTGPAEGEDGGENALRSLGSTM